MIQNLLICYMTINVSHLHFEPLVKIYRKSRTSPSIILIPKVWICKSIFGLKNITKIRTAQWPKSEFDPDKNYPGQVGSIFCQVGSGQPFMVWVWKISPKNIKLYFLCFRSKSTRVKSGSASYLLRVKSKLGSGQGPSLQKTQKIPYGPSQKSSVTVNKKNNCWLLKNICLK